MINKSKLEKIIKEYLNKEYPLGKKKYKISDDFVNEFEKYYNSRKKSDSDDNDDIILELGEKEYNIVLNLYHDHIKESNKKYQKDNSRDR